MKTMVRDPDHDYDIDDGVYFRKEDLVGDRGAEMTSLQARQMVRDAVDDGKFKRSPEVRANCVRVFYEKGYHVDLPVFVCMNAAEPNFTSRMSASKLSASFLERIEAVIRGMLGTVPLASRRA